MSSSVSVTVMGVVIVFNRVFWFCSRWPMVVDRDLSRYLVAYAVIGSSHYLKNIDSTDLCRSDRTEHSSV